MGDSDKTVALKVAYADIILNMAKEAAARVMVAEKRAASFQHQLNCSKDESLRLLLRLKHMIDAKTIEAETTSFNQKRKIDELEAQLHEAEDIITDLRVELSYLWDKLERANNTQVRPLSGQITCEDVSSLKDPAAEPSVQSPLRSGYLTVTESDMMNNGLNQGYPGNRSCNASKQIDQPNVSHVETYYPHSSDLTTVLVASKKPELYRNGCTQRICALERNLLDGKLTPGDLDDQNSILREEFIMETSAEDERQCMQSSPKTKNLKAMDISGEETKKSIKVRMKRRRKTRFSRIKAAPRRFRPGQRMKQGQPSSVLSCCRTYTTNRNVKPGEVSCTVSSIKVGNIDGTKNSRELEEELQHESSCHEDEIVAIHNGKTNGKVKSSNGIATPFQSLPDQPTDPCQMSTVLSCSKTSRSVCLNVKSKEDQLKAAETETKIKSLACLDPGLTLIKCNVDPLSGSKNVTVNVRALNKSRFAQCVADNDIKLGDGSVLVRKEGNSRETSTLPSSEMSSNRVNVSSGYSDLTDAKASKVTHESSTKVDNTKDRLLKYTFQRKRKKELLTNLDERTSEESSLKRRAEEKENSLQGTAKSSNLVNESSTDSRRLAQVARQLISLSGKRWW
ncbi:hypothetical protein DITRI_Ditri16bG0122700 [Diplodiscus trichospermus]